MDWSTVLKQVIDKIEERESTYRQTWKSIPTGDLIANARVKTFRATTMLETGNIEKLKDDVIDAIAYLLFVLAKIDGSESSVRKKPELPSPKVEAIICSTCGKNTEKCRCGKWVR